jgi:hypothetical protein
MCVIISRPIVVNFQSCVKCSFGEKTEKGKIKNLAGPTHYSRFLASPSPQLVVNGDDCHVAANNQGTARPDTTNVILSLLGCLPLEASPHFWFLYSLSFCFTPPPLLLPIKNRARRRHEASLAESFHPILYKHPPIPSHDIPWSSHDMSYVA